MSKTFNEALVLFVQKYCNLDYLPIIVGTELKDVIVGTELKDGYDFEYSEYTRDHQNAEFIIKYKYPRPTHNKVFECNIDILYYDGGFGKLVKDIAELMD